MVTRTSTEPELLALVDANRYGRRLMRSQSLSSLPSRGISIRIRQKRRPQGQQNDQLLRFLRTCCCAFLFVITGIVATFFICLYFSKSKTNNAVVSSFVSSTVMLESLHISHDEVPAEGFMDAIDALSPALDSLGVLFAIASKEIFGNVEKLRAFASNYEGNEGFFDIRPNNSSRSWRFYREVSMQRMVRDALEICPYSSCKQSADGPFEALRWLDFGLEFMEKLFQCVSLRKDNERMKITPGIGVVSVCAQEAYDLTLRLHHGSALRTISGHILRMVPCSLEFVREKTGLDDAANGALLSRWAKAIHRPRRAVRQFYASFPDHIP
jgi:hypothetical protein